MQRLFLPAILVLCFWCLNVQAQQKVHFTNTKFLHEISSPDPVRYTFEVYQLPNQTYAYVIFANGAKYLHQQNMPGKSPAQGFASKESTQKVAELIIRKLEIPTSLPRVSTKEMEHLNIK